MNLVPSNLNRRRLSSSRTRLKELDNELKEIHGGSRNSDMKAPPLALSLGHKYSHEWDRVPNVKSSGHHPIGVRARERSPRCSKSDSQTAYTAKLVALADSSQATATLCHKQYLASMDMESSLKGAASLLQQLVDIALRKKGLPAKGQAVDASVIPTVQLEAPKRPFAPARTVPPAQCIRHRSGCSQPCPRSPSVPAVSVPEWLPIMPAVEETGDTSQGRITHGSFTISTVACRVQLSATSVLGKGKEVAVAPLSVPSKQELSLSSPQHVLGRDLPTPARALAVYCSERPTTISPHISSDREPPPSSQGRDAIRGIAPPSSPTKADPLQPLPHAMALVVVQKAYMEAASSLIPSSLAQESNDYKCKCTPHSRAKPKEPDKAPGIQPQEPLLSKPAKARPFVLSSTGSILCVCPNSSISSQTVRARRLGPISIVSKTNETNVPRDSPRPRAALTLPITVPTHSSQAPSIVPSGKTVPQRWDTKFVISNSNDPRVNQLSPTFETAPAPSIPLPTVLLLSSGPSLLLEEDKVISEMEEGQPPNMAVSKNTSFLRCSPILHAASALPKSEPARAIWPVLSIPDSNVPKPVRPLLVANPFDHHGIRPMMPIVRDKCQWRLPTSSLAHPIPAPHDMSSIPVFKSEDRCFQTTCWFPMRSKPSHVHSSQICSSSLPSTRKPKQQINTIVNKQLGKGLPMPREAVAQQPPSSNEGECSRELSQSFPGLIIGVQVPMPSDKVANELDEAELMPASRAHLISHTRLPNREYSAALKIVSAQHRRNIVSGTDTMSDKYSHVLCETVSQQSRPHNTEERSVGHPKVPFEIIS
jgi:hypothetical protein